MIFVQRTVQITRLRSWLLSIVACVAFAPAIEAQELASDWTHGHKNRVRLTAGAVEGVGQGAVFAFVEIGLDKGWKTYWRNPGTAGGIPPVFDWTKSRNVREAEVLLPVPQIISDKAGDVIGYKEFVIFPVRILPERPGEAIDLDVVASYGICETLCVPVEATLRLTIPPGDLPAASPDAVAAFEKVPRSGAALRPGDPTGLTVVRKLSGPDAAVMLTARFPGGADEAQVFVDVADGRFIPLPVRHGADDEVVTFRIDLSNAQDLQAVKGATVRATLKGSQGQSETTFTID